MNDTHRFRHMFKQLKASIAEESSCLYMLHTPLGILEVVKINYLMPGFAVLTGRDEADKTRVLVMSDEQMCSFPLELLPKTTGTNKSIGFKASAEEE